MKVVVTGSTGIVGRAVVGDALGRGWEVVGLARSTGCDLTDRSAALAAITGAAPDVVVHCAALADVDRCEREPDEARRQNVDATAHVAAAAEAVGAHLVHVSTDYVFDGAQATPYGVDDPTAPVQEYGRSKLAAEAVALDGGGTVVRTSWVSGVVGASTVRRIVEGAQQGTPLRFVSDQVSQPTVAADLADRLLGLAALRHAGIVHATGQGPMTWYEVARAALEGAGLDPALVQPVTLAEAMADRPAPRPTYSVLDGSSLVERGLPPMPDSAQALSELAARIIGGSR